jgi:hypothetical protein
MPRAVSSEQSKPASRNCFLTACVALSSLTPVGTLTPFGKFFWMYASIWALKSSSIAFTVIRLRVTAIPVAVLPGGKLYIRDIRA